MKLKGFLAGAGLVALSAATAGFVGSIVSVGMARQVLQADERPGALNEFPVQSAVMGETFTLRVNLPNGYALHPDRSYPVLWVTDGTSHLQHATQTSLVLNQLELAPEMIVVAVPSSSHGRAQDFLPPGPEYGGNEGRADRFLEFLIQDARPAIDGAFRTTEDQVLMGHSFGGVFASWGWTERPGAFTGWIVSSPSWWVGAGAVVERITDRTSTGIPAESYLFASVGADEGGDMLRRFEQGQEVLGAIDPEGRNHHAEVTPDADHGSNPRLTLPRALEHFWRWRRAR